MKLCGRNSTGKLTSQELYKLALELIPGGSQLLSKRSEQFSPNLWPAYYKKAKGLKFGG